MRRILFRAGTIVLLIAIAVCMMIIGRGHTIYFDNKTLEAEDGTGGERLDRPPRGCPKSFGSPTSPNGE